MEIGDRGGGRSGQTMNSWWEGVCGPVRRRRCHWVPALVFKPPNMQESHTGNFVVLECLWLALDTKRVFGVWTQLPPFRMRLGRKWEHADSVTFDMVTRNWMAIVNAAAIAWYQNQGKRAEFSQHAIAVIFAIVGFFFLRVSGWCKYEGKGSVWRSSHKIGEKNVLHGEPEHTATRNNCLLMH